MDQPWNIEYYKNARGDELVKDFIQSLPLLSQTRVRATLKLLQEYGIQLGRPHSKKLSGTPLWELRVLGESSVRIFYVAKINRTFWLLHGFIKKSQKTSENELKMALKRLAEIDIITKL